MFLRKTNGSSSAKDTVPFVVDFVELVKSIGLIRELDFFVVVAVVVVGVVVVSSVVDAVVFFLNKN